jgi:DNA-directed RNA polymerase specialized sigma24 family protein
MPDPESREIYLLHHLDGVSIRELSQRTLRSEDAIKSDLYRIRKKITEGN